MSAFGNFLIMSGFVGLCVGIVTVIRPIQSLGFERRRDGCVVTAVSLVVMMFGGALVGPQEQQNASVKASPTKPVATPVTYKEALKNLTIGSFSWQKDGFGTVMTATFVIYNRNKFPVKDIEVTCIHAAKSGTRIDSNTRTVYERIEAHSYQSVHDINMGFIHSAATSSRCDVTDFSRS